MLLTYAAQGEHAAQGYTQGMSDLAAPLLAHLENESDAYWCFEGLMQRTVFVASPHDDDIDTHLVRM